MKNRNGFRNLHQRPGRRLRGVEWRTRENEAESFRWDTCLWSAWWRGHSPVRIASVMRKKKKWGWLMFWERGGGREGGGDSCSVLPLPAWFFNFLLLCWRNLRLRESERLWFTALKVKDYFYVLKLLGGYAKICIWSNFVMCKKGFVINLILHIISPNNGRYGEVWCQYFNFIKHFNRRCDTYKSFLKKWYIIVRKDMKIKLTWDNYNVTSGSQLTYWILHN